MSNCGALNRFSIDNVASVPIDEDSDCDSGDERLASLDALRLSLLTAPFLRHFNDIGSCLSPEQLGDAYGLPPRCAILVKSVSFSYDKHINVLNDISVNVPQGKIYALLGSSSCGKTTLLKCIVGRFRPKKGTIRVFGSRPGEKNCPVPGIGVGYMPQEMALLPEFTIEETLQYYGQLYRMSMAIIYQRINFLLSLLNLPDEKKLVRDLSDGQRWRISLAVSLVHSPPLLLLDEPTVGVDPLLRGSIWDHLNGLCKEEGLTVLITTHYIEEAGAAYMAGLMRNGRLLAEDRPDDLLQRFETNSFERVFLKLCQSDSFSNKFEDSTNCSLKDEPINDCSSDTHQIRMAHWPCDYHFRVKTSIPFRRIQALVNKNCIKLRGNMLILLFFLILPSLQMTLFCIQFGKVPRKLSVAIYSPEKPPFLSRHFLRSLDRNTIFQINYPSVNESIDAIRRGKVWAAISLSSNFSDGLKMRQSDLLNKNDNTDIIKLHIDMSNAVIGQQLIYSIFKSLIQFLRNAYDAKYLPPSPILLSPIPIKVSEVIFGSTDASFMEFLAPGYILTTIFLVQLLITAFLLIREQMDGLLERCLITGVSCVEVLLSHFLTQFFVLILQESLILTVAFIIFKVPLRGPIISLFGLVFLQGLCGISFGLLIAAICPNPVSAMLLSSGIIIPAVVVSGINWPIQSMPLIMQNISHYLPLTMPIEALRCIISRGMTVRYRTVMSGFTISGVYCVLLLVATVVIFKIKTSK